MGITSIILPVYNQLSWTQECISNIRNYTEKNTYEIIVVDNASEDDTNDWLSAQTDIKLITNRTNEGFLLACNKAVQAAVGTEYLIMHNDVIVGPNWLKVMKKMLYTDTRIGAVGPLSTKAVYLCNHFQYVNVPIGNKQEFLFKSNEFYKKGENEYKVTNYLQSYCLLIKKTVVDKIGLFDPVLKDGFLEDVDFSISVLKAGYTLVVARGVLVYHELGATLLKVTDNIQNLANEAVKKMKDKWHFTVTYSLGVRNELLDALDFKRNNLSVLEIGCSCGGTLLEILNRNYTTKIYGIEIDEDAAAIARCVLGDNISTINIEDTDLPMEKESLDYIIMADVLEHLYNPWKIISMLKEYLKPNGIFLASIPNIKHVSAVKDLFNADWKYLDAGILDRTHLRFFTKEEIEKIFINEAKYSKVDIGITQSWDDVEFIKKLNNTVVEGQPEYNILQWVVTAHK